MPIAFPSPADGSRVEEFEFAHAELMCVFALETDEDRIRSERLTLPREQPWAISSLTLSMFCLI